MPHDRSPAENLTLATLVQTDVLDDMNAQGWGIPNDGVLPDTTLGSYVGDPSAGGIAGEAASYNHLLLLGPASAGYFSTPEPDARRSHRAAVPDRPVRRFDC